MDGKLIKFSDSLKKSDCRYNEDRIVHEKLIVNGEIGILKHKIIHFSYTSYKDYKLKMYNYGVLKAQEKNKKKDKNHHT